MLLDLGGTRFCERGRVLVTLPAVPVLLVTVPGFFICLLRGPFSLGPLPVRSGCLAPW